MSKDNEAKTEHENFTRLKANKKGALAFASGIASDKADDLEKREGDLKKSESEILNAAKGALTARNFSAAIQKLDQLKDAKIGISWHESKDLGQGTKALVRDARNITQDKSELKNDAGEKYAMQALNEIRAAIDLLDAGPSTNNEKKQEAQDNLMATAQYAINQVEQGELNDKSIKEINTYVVAQIEAAGVEDAAQKLNFAKEVASLKDEHKHIVTLTSVKDPQNQDVVTVIEADIMLNGLTDKQKEMYEAIAKTNPKGSIINNKSDMAWYNEMPEYKRKLLADVAGDIAKGNKVIPAQLLKDVPGLRNAYDKVTAVKREDQEPQIVAETLHCGAPATKIKLSDKAPTKEIQKSIVAENVAQLQSFVQADKTIHLNNLTSVTPGNARGEDFIQRQVANAAEKNDKVVASTSPINRWRLFGGGGREQKEFNNTLRQLGESIKGDKRAAANYLQNGDSRIRRFVSRVTFGLVETNYQKAQTELSSNDDVALRAAVDVKKRLSETTLFSNAENINLEISAKMSVVNTYQEKGKNTLPVMVNYCKSGKDRTGLVMMESSHQAVSSALGLDPNSDLAKQNKFSMVAGGHTQEMAGIQGGTTGCHSIKTNPEFGLNKSDKELDGIINQKSAKFNSSIKVVKEKMKSQVIVSVADDSEEKNKAQESSPLIGSNLNETLPDLTPPESQPPVDDKGQSHTKFSPDDQRKLEAVKDSIGKNSQGKTPHTKEQLKQTPQPQKRKGGRGAG